MTSRSTNPPFRARIPWYFQLARERIAANRRGGYFLLGWIKRLGLLDQCAPFGLSERETIAMPLDWPMLWRKDLFDVYESEAIALFAAAVEEMARPAFLIDCGADVGLFTRLVLTRTRRIDQVVAFEPNPRSHSILQRNLSDLPFPARALQAGIGATMGYATLAAAPGTDDLDYADHSQYLQPADRGIPVRTIDSLGVPSGAAVAIKLDVEGAELDALRGARATLAGASDFVLQIEAHRDVMIRTGTDPIEFLQATREIAPVDCVACEEGTRLRYENIEPERPFFDQVGDREHRVLDMIIRRRGVSHRSAAGAS